MDNKEQIQYVNEKYPAQFKVACHGAGGCGREIAVRKDVFVKRLQKAQETKNDAGELGNLKMLLTGYLCKKCQKKLNKNMLGGVATTTSGTTKVITDLPEGVECDAEE
jgi:hypothetical protein